MNTSPVRHATGWVFKPLGRAREATERKRLQECKEFFASVAVGNLSSFVPVLAADAGSGRRYGKREGLRRTWRPGRYCREDTGSNSIRWQVKEYGSCKELVLGVNWGNDFSYHGAGKRPSK